MAGLTRKGKVYYALFTTNGKTKWIRIGKVSYQDARKLLKKLESDHDKGKLGLIETTSQTFSRFSAEYLRYSKANKAKGTWERDITSIRALDSFFTNKLLESIDPKAIEDYKAKRQEEGRTNRTINIELLCLGHMLKKAMEWRYISSRPEIKKLTVQKKPPRYLSKTELNSLIDSATPWLRFILIVLRNTGLRSKQLRELKLQHADYESEAVMIMNSKGNDYYVIPMNEELKAVLLYLSENYVSPRGKISPRLDHQKIYFFCKPDGKPIGSFRTSFYKAVNKAGLNNVTPHTLRHTFASHLVMSGVDLPTVKELLGHKDISTTMIYSHLSNEHKANAVGKLLWAKPKLKLASD
jgi:site-specific recombinase XerD